MRIFLFANRRFKGDRFLRDLQDLADFRHGDVHPLGDFFRRWFASQFLYELPRGANQLVDRFDHVDRDTNRTRLIGNRTSNCLPNPPRGISRKLIAAAIFELVHGFHQADISFLNQVEELQSAIGIFFRNRHDQSKVRFNQLPLRLLGVHVALDDLALCALEFQKQHARFLLEFLELRSDATCLSSILFFLVFAARGVSLALQVLSLSIKRPHAVHRAVQPLDEALAFVVGETQVTDRQRNLHDGASQREAVTPIILWPFFLRNRYELFGNLVGFLVRFLQFVDASRESLQALLNDLFGNLFLVKRDYFLDRANTLFEVFP